MVCVPVNPACKSRSTEAFRFKIARPDVCIVEEEEERFALFLLLNKTRGQIAASEKKKNGDG